MVLMEREAKRAQALRVQAEVLKQLKEREDRKREELERKKIEERQRDKQLAEQRQREDDQRRRELREREEKQAREDERRRAAEEALKKAAEEAEKRRKERRKSSRRSNDQVDSAFESGASTGSRTPNEPQNNTVLIGSPIKLRKTQKPVMNEETTPDTNKNQEEIPDQNVEATDNQTKPLIIPKSQTPVINYIHPNISTYVDNNVNSSEYYQLLRPPDVMVQSAPPVPNVQILSAREQLAYAPNFMQNQQIYHEIQKESSQNVSKLQSSLESLQLTYTPNFMAPNVQPQIVYTVRNMGNEFMQKPINCDKPDTANVPNPPEFSQIVLPQNQELVTPNPLPSPNTSFQPYHKDFYPHQAILPRYASAGSLCHVACGSDRPLTPSKFRSGQLKEAWTQTDEKNKRRSVSSSDGGASSVRNNGKRRPSNERPKWGANRPTVRYVTQSEKDPFYELRRSNGGRRKHRQIRLRRAYEIQQEYSVDGSSEDDQPNDEVFSKSTSDQSSNTETPSKNQKPKQVSRNIIHQTTEIVPLVRTSSGLTRKDRLDEQNENQKKKSSRNRKWSSGSSSDVILEQLMTGSGVWKNKGIVTRNGWRKIEKNEGSDEDLRTIERLEIED
ncbi:myosin-M heavy chain-like [Ctenocephalides felis]|uniref:myosin-M heavy chain-like n=1 Tax=Ctenocephalides felis TaxID=7515 RepID=UPI000E6E270B|nr:myosin-M heavy chain-like [Ctenocephalides felis]